MKNANKIGMTTDQLKAFYNAPTSVAARAEIEKKMPGTMAAIKAGAVVTTAKKAATTPVRIDSRAKLPVAPAPKAKKTEVKKVAPAKTEKAIAHSSVQSLKIKLLVKENPKKATAALRFDLYEDGMTVEEYVAKGGQVRDVNWDRKMGWISTK